MFGEAGVKKRSKCVFATACKRTRRPGWCCCVRTVDPAATHMLSPSKWCLVTAPTDLYCDLDRLLVHVREVLGRDPGDCGAYVFRNRSTSRVKSPSCDASRTWLAVHRLLQRRFHWPQEGAIKARQELLFTVLFSTILGPHPSYGCQQELALHASAQ